MLIQTTSYTFFIVHVNSDMNSRICHFRGDEREAGKKKKKKKLRKTLNHSKTSFSNPSYRSE